MFFDTRTVQAMKLGMTNDRTILMTGVTGHQGGAVAEALHARGFRVRGLTRKPESEQAAALARHGVDVVKGDLDDEGTLRPVLTGASGVFGVQNTWEAGVEREEVPGKRLATLARAAGVEHYVYTSVASADMQTGIPHFLPSHVGSGARIRRALRISTASQAALPRGRSAG